MDDHLLCEVIGRVYVIEHGDRAVVHRCKVCGVISVGGNSITDELLTMTENGLCRHNLYPFSSISIIESDEYRSQFVLSLSHESVISATL